MDRVIYFIYSLEENPQPLGEGTALYARVYSGEFSYTDYKWSGPGLAWVENDYLGYLTLTGSPDLDNLSPDDLPESVTRF